MARSRLPAWVVFFSASVALAQPGGFGAAAPQTPTPLVNVMLPYVGDENLTVELKLTADQVKKLTDYRQKVWDETYTTKPSELRTGAEAREKATETAFKETLTPAQFERVKQLAARALLVETPRSKEALSFSARTFNRYPELVAAVKLSDEQKKSLDPAPGAKGSRPPSAPLTLTADQTAALEKFMGAAPANTFVPVTDPRVARSGSFGAPFPADLLLIRVNDVQSDLKLTDDQAKAAADLMTRWTTSSRATSTRNDLSPQERDKQLDEVKQETEKFLASGLKPEQAARLRQINVQRVQFNSTRDAFLRTPEVAKPLGLNEEQFKQLEAAAAEWEAGMVKVFETDQNFEATNRAVAAVNAARNDRANAVLTPDQTAKLKELIGAPYTGSYTSSPFGGPGGIPGGFDRGDRGPGGPGDRGPGGLGQPVPRNPETSFGKPILDLAVIARIADVQAELKMTPEQVQKATAAYTALPPTTPSGTPDAVAARAAASEKAVADILTADQKKRFRQVMIQIYDSPSSSSNLYMRLGSVAYPGVAEAIKLTPEQKAKILAGTRAADVLTAEQTAEMKKMAGEPYKGVTTFTAAGSKSGFGPAPGGGPAQPPTRNPFVSTAIPARVRLIGGTTLDEPLKVTPEQRTAIAAAYKEYQAARTRTRDGSLRGADTVNKALAEIAEKFEKDATAALNPDQRKRLEQLLVQSEAADSLVAYLRQPAVAKKLDITADQAQKITAVFADDEKIGTLLTAQHLPIQKQNDLAAKVRDRSDAHLLAVLSDQQRTAWKEMTGEAYTGFRKTPLGPRPAIGGGGGFGGPPGDNP